MEKILLKNEHRINLLASHDHDDSLWISLLIDIMKLTATSIISNSSGIAFNLLMFIAAVYFHALTS